MSAFWIELGLLCMWLFFLHTEDSSRESKGWTICSGIISVIIVFALAGCYIIKDDGGPKAIDVYRGNTTLQITYQDSIPIDSVVVFKQL